MKLSVVITKLSLLLAVILAMGCSNPSKDIRERIQKGMDKDDVLEELGNPSRSKRVKGADRWSYDQYKDDVKTTTHIYFKSGKVREVLRDDQLIKQIKEMSKKNKSKKTGKSQSFRDL